MKAEQIKSPWDERIWELQTTSYEVFPAAEYSLLLTKAEGYRQGVVDTEDQYAELIYSLLLWADCGHEFAHPECHRPHCNWEQVRNEALAALAKAKGRST